MDCASCQAGGKKRASKKTSKRSSKKVKRVSKKKGSKKQKGGMNPYMEQRVKLSKMIREEVGAKTISDISKLIGSLEAKALAKNPAMTSTERITEAVKLYLADKESVKAQFAKLSQPAPARATKKKSKKSSKKSSKKH